MLGEPPLRVRVLPREATKGVDIQHPFLGEIVSTNGRDHGSLTPAIFVLHNGQEYLLFDNEWEEASA